MPVPVVSRVVVVLDADTQSITVWSSETRTDHILSSWERTLNIERGDWLRVSEDLSIREKLNNPVFQTRISDKDLLEIRIPYIQVEDDGIESGKPNGFVGYAPFFGQIGRFFRANFEPNRMYWVWASRIPEENEKLQMYKKLFNPIMSFMIKNQVPEEIRRDEMENVFWAKKIEGVVVGIRNNSNLVWNENNGICIVFSSGTLLLNKWINFFALNFDPFLKNTTGVYGLHIPVSRIHVYPIVNEDEQKFEVKIFVSKQGFEQIAYRAARFGYVFDEDRVVDESYIGCTIKAIVNFNLMKEKWIIEDVVGSEEAKVGIVCWVDESKSSVHVFSKFFEDSIPNRTLYLKPSIFKPKKPQIGECYALIYDSENNVVSAVVSDLEIYDFKIRGQSSFLLLRTWVKIAEKWDGIYGYSEELGIEAVDNTNRLRKALNETEYDLYIAYVDNEEVGLGWKIFQYTEIFDHYDPWGRKLSRLSYIKNNNETSMGYPQTSSSPNMVNHKTSSTKKKHKRNKIKAAIERDYENDKPDGTWDGVPETFDLVKIDD